MELSALVYGCLIRDTSDGEVIMVIGRGFSDDVFESLVIIEGGGAAGDFGDIVLDDNEYQSDHWELVE